MLRGVGRCGYGLTVVSFGLAWIVVGSVIEVFVRWGPIAGCLRLVVWRLCWSPYNVVTIASVRSIIRFDMVIVEWTVEISAGEGSVVRANSAFGAILTHWR